MVKSDFYLRSCADPKIDEGVMVCEVVVEELFGIATLSLFFIFLGH
jgi:hypothetical protein